MKSSAFWCLQSSSSNPTNQCSIPSNRNTNPREQFQILQARPFGSNEWASKMYTITLQRGPLGTSRRKRLPLTLPSVLPLPQANRAIETIPVYLQSLEILFVLAAGQNFMHFWYGNPSKSLEIDHWRRYSRRNSSENHQIGLML